MNPTTTAVIMAALQHSRDQVLAIAAQLQEDRLELLEAVARLSSLESHVAALLEVVQPYPPAAAADPSAPTTEV